MPRQHAVIVGGGVIGLCLAWELTRRDWQVTILDAGPFGGGASFGNAGWVVPALSDPVPAPGLIRQSLRWMLRADSPLYIKPRADLAFTRWLVGFWRHCNARDFAAGLAATAALNRRTFALYDSLAAAGVVFERHQTGLLFAYRSATALQHDHAGLDLLAPFGLQVPPVLTGAEIRAREPVLTEAIVGGYHLPDEQHLQPASLIAGLVAALTTAGATLRATTPATGFDRAGDRVLAVRTATDGIAADAVVIAAGAWTPLLAKLVGVRLPIQAGKGYSLDYSPPPHAVRHAMYLHEDRVAVTPWDGSVRLAGTMEFSGLNSKIAPARVAAIARAGHAALRNWPLDPTPIAPWVGPRPMTPDGLPIIGRLPGFQNLAIAAGHAMLGVTLAPATAEALAELLSTGNLPAVLRPFAPDRFGR